QALKYQSIIDAFLDLHKDLCALELSTEEWMAILQVSEWLKLFWIATTEMSQTKTKLPDNINITIKSGLLAAHQKLSEYYYWFDQSPFYTWAAVLDPRIMYKGLKEEYAGDIGLTKYLEEMKDQLQKYYEDFYANNMEPLLRTNSTST
ncbi:hypothetical protein C0991_000651, partial [Blastosporella zonata]